MDMPTRRLPTCGLDNSQTGHLADWTTRGCHRQLWVLSFHSFGGICETASCLVRKLTSPRDVQSTSWQSANWRIRELSSYRFWDMCADRHIDMLIAILHSRTEAGKVVTFQAERFAVFFKLISVCFCCIMNHSHVSYHAKVWCTTECTMYIKKADM